MLLEDFLKEKLINHGDDNKVYFEWMTLDVRKIETKRVELNLLQVFGKVGGVTHILTMFLTYIFTKYAELNFKIDAINAIFFTRTNKMTLIDDESKLSINIFYKLLLLTGCCADKRLNRFLDKGNRYLGKELDIIKIRKELTNL